MADDSKGASGIYQDLVSKGYPKGNLGEEEQFVQAMSDKGRRKKFYDNASRRGFDLGTYDEFETNLTAPPVTQEEQPQPQPQPAQANVETKPEQAQEKPQQTQEKQAEKPQQATASSEVSPKDENDNRGYWGKILDNFKAGPSASVSGVPYTAENTKEELERERREKERKRREEYDATATGVSADSWGQYIDEWNNFVATDERLNEDIAEARGESGEKGKDILHTDWEELGNKEGFLDKDTWAIRADERKREDELLKQREQFTRQMLKGQQVFKEQGGTDKPIEIEQDGKKVYLTSGGYTTDDEAVAQLATTRYNDAVKELEAQTKSTKEQVGDLQDRLNEIAPDIKSERGHLIMTPSYAYSHEKSQLPYNISIVEATQRKVNQIQKFIRIAEKYRDDDIGFLHAFGYGVQDAITDAGTYDFGFMDLTTAAAACEILKKTEAGKKLKPEEEALLDAYALEYAARSEYAQYIGRGYGAGQQAVEFGVLAAKLAANPFSGVGAGAEKAFMGWLEKKGLGYLTKGAAGYATRFMANGVAHAVPSAVGLSLLQTPEWMAAGIEGGMDFQTNGGEALPQETDTGAGIYYDNEGRRTQIKGGIAESGKSLAQSIGQSYKSQLIGNWAMMMVPEVGKVTGAAGKGIAKAAEKVTPEFVADYISKVGTQEAARGFDSFLKAVDLPKRSFDFYASMQLGNILDAATPGGQEFHNEEGTGVLDLGRQVDEYVNALMFETAMGAARGASYGWGRYQLGRRFNAQYQNMEAGTWRNKQAQLAELTKKFESGDEQQTADAMKSLFADQSLTKEQLEDALTLGGLSAQRHFTERMFNETYANESVAGDKVHQGLVDNFNEGLQIVNPNLRFDKDGSVTEASGDEAAPVTRDTDAAFEANGKYNIHRQEVLDMCGKDVLAQLDEDPQGTLRTMRNTGVDAVTLQACEEYANARQKMVGIDSALGAEATVEAVQSAQAIRMRQQKDGMLHHATLKDGRQVDILGETGTSATVIDENGDKFMIPMSDIAEIGETESADALIKQEAQRIQDEYSAQRQELYNPRLQFQPGDVYDIEMPDGSRGKVTVIWQAFDPETGVEIPDKVRVRMPDGTEREMDKSYIQQQWDLARSTDWANEINDNRRRQIEQENGGEIPDQWKPTVNETTEAENPTNETPVEEGGEVEVGSETATEGEGGTESPEEQPEQRTYGIGDKVQIVDDQGNVIDAEVTQVHPDGTLIVEYEGGQKPYTREALNEAEAEAREAQQPAEQPAETPAEQPAEQPAEEEPQQQSALEQIPKTVDGKHNWQEAPSVEVAVDGMIELAGDRDRAKKIADQTLKASKKALEQAKKKAEKTDEKQITDDFESNLAVDNANNAEVESAQKKVDFWQSAIDEIARREEAEKQAVIDQLNAEQERLAETTEEDTAEAPETPTEESGTPPAGEAPAEEPVATETPSEETPATPQTNGTPATETPQNAPEAENGDNNGGAVKTGQELKELADKNVSDKKVPAEKAEKIDLKNFVSNGKDGTVFSRVYYKDGYAYATNTYAAIKVRMDYPEEYEGKTVNPKTGEAVESKYPDFDKTIDGVIEKGTVVKVNKETLDQARGVIAGLPKGRQRKDYPLEHVAVAFDGGEGMATTDAGRKSMFIDTKYLSAINNILENADNAEIYANGNALVVVADGVKSVIMPLRDADSESSNYSGIHELIKDGRLYLDNWGKRSIDITIDHIRAEIKNGVSDGVTKAMKEKEDSAREWLKRLDGSKKRLVKELGGLVEISKEEAKDGKAILERLVSDGEGKLSADMMSEMEAALKRTNEAEEVIKKNEETRERTKRRKLAEIEQWEKIKENAKSLEEFREQDKLGNSTEPPHTRTAAREKRAKERREAVEGEVKKMTDALGTTVRILDSIDQVRDPKTRAAIEAGDKSGEKVTGWYDPATGEVVVYYPNLIDANEAKLTYLHEVVGHKGLRALFGDKFEDTMKDVYRRMPKRLQDSVQKRMDDEDFKSKKYSDPLVASVEEELSNWAEKNKKPDWWSRTVSSIRDMIRKVVDLEMTDADIDYLLWRSRHNLEEQTLQQRATDKVLEQRARKANEEARKNGQVLFREKDEELVERAKAIGRIEPTVVEKSPKDKTEAREIYSGIGKVRNKADGREVEFYKGILGKLPYERGLFFKSIPGLKDAFANSVLAYSDTDDRTGEKRPDGTVHKAHPNVKEYHNYVGKVQIDGKDYYVRFTVTEERGRDRNGLHSAFVSSIDLYEKGATPATMTNLQTLQGKHREGVADAKLREFFERARKAEEKVSGNEEKSSEARFRIREYYEATDEEREIIRKAEENGTLGQAPNGKESELYRNYGEVAWAMVRTPQFKNWFGDWEKGENSSKVVDRNGEPLVVYHGSRTGGDFSVFDGETFFIDNRDVAEMFRNDASFFISVNGRERRLAFQSDMEEIAGYLTGGDYNAEELNGCLLDRDGTQWDELQEYQKDNLRDLLGLNEDEDLEEISIESAAPVFEVFLNIRNPLVVDFANEVWQPDNAPEFSLRKAKEAGYDGMIINNIVEGGLVAELPNGDDVPPATDYIVLKPNQVKSVENNGEFSMTSNDIRFRTREKESANDKIAEAERETDTEPTDKQKESGNYKKGKVKVAGYDITIENPRGSTRSGTDANGKRWEQEMRNTYGYIRGTEGTDGDHIDVFLAPDMDAWDGKNVYVVDQYNPDGTFDEHKVMLGFDNTRDAKQAYLDNYEKGWENGRRIDVSEVSKDNFDKWIDSSHRKTKAFADYSGTDAETLPSATERERKQQAHDRAQQISDEAEKRIYDEDRALEQRRINSLAQELGMNGYELPENADLDNTEGLVVREAARQGTLKDSLGERWDEFLKKVYQNTDEETLQDINEFARQNGWNFAEATERYLASLSDNGAFEQAVERGMWDGIKSAFNGALEGKGFEFGAEDNDIRYALWRNERNKTESPNGTLLARATEVATNNALSNENSPMFRIRQDDPNDPKVLYRNGVNEPAEVARIMEFKLSHQTGLRRWDWLKHWGSRRWFQIVEAWQDSMQALYEFMKACEGDNWKGEAEVADYMNPYTRENRLSSKNEDDINVFTRKCLAPMFDEAKKLAKNDRERRLLNNYIISKHGLERNEYMAEREARNAFEKQSPDASWDDLPDEVKDALVSQARRDYAGLTGLFGLEGDEWQQAEAEARELVDSYETAHDTERLWKTINATSESILKKQLDTGLISKETYDKIKGMYEYYVPLRGFEETTTDDEYAYLNYQRGEFNNPIRRAEGRTSLANDPFESLAGMAQSGIIYGNRNQLVKQAFYNFVKAHPSDYMTESPLWLRKGEDGEWEAVFCDTLKDGDSPDEVSRKLAEFERQMKQAQEEHPDLYATGRQAHSLPYKMPDKTRISEHQVVVRIGGRDKVLTVNGNPRLAQAVNGKTNPDVPMQGWQQALNKWTGSTVRFLSQVHTTWNPDFIISNYLRDVGYSNVMAWVKENGIAPEYARRFTANTARCNPGTMLTLLDQRRRGTLNTEKGLGKYFEEFMGNGGETGYARMQDRDKIAKDIRKKLHVTTLGAAKDAIDAVGELAGELGRAVELSQRFAAFVTSRESGRDVGRSIYDAKEITVNFNKKGAGSTFVGRNGQTWAGDVAGLISGAGRDLFMFWNAGVQGTANITRNTLRSGQSAAKAATAFGTLMLLGYMRGMSGGDEEKEKKDVAERGDSYWDLPTYTRRTSFCFRGKGGWTTIPISIELRLPYGVGEIMGSYARGHEKDKDLVWDVGDLLGHIVFPVNFLEGQEAGSHDFLMPLVASPLRPAYEAARNRSWSGRRIYSPEMPWNEGEPRYQRAYRNTDKVYIGLSKGVSDLTGGDEFEGGAINLPPEALQYMFQQYFPFYTTMNQGLGLYRDVTGQKDFSWRDVPIANRIKKDSGEQLHQQAVSRDYWENKKDADALVKKVKKLDKKERYDEADEIMESQKYWNAEEFQDYEKAISDAMKDASDPDLTDEEREAARRELTELQEEANTIMRRRSEDEGD